MNLYKETFTMKTNIITQKNSKCKYFQLLCVMCILTTSSTIAQNNCQDLSIQIDLNHISCYGSQDGNAAVSILSGTGPYEYEWSPGNEISSSINNLSAGTYTITVTDVGSTTTSGIELVVNGNFEQGNTGFNSQYGYDDVPPLNEGMYYIANNGNSMLNDWYPCYDHTTGGPNGHMMLLNGATTANVSIWCQTITVSPNTDYQFSSWVTPVLGYNPPILQFSINNNLLDLPFHVSSGGCQWQNFSSTWNSGVQTTAEICIVNQNTIGGGNDFAIDDISFQAINMCTLTQTIQITEPDSIHVIANVSTSCTQPNNASIDITITGGTPSYSFLWSNGSTTEDIAQLSDGTYELTVEDANGCLHQLYSAQISSPSSTMNIDSVITPISCHGADDGSININISGSNQYNIIWSNSSSSEFISSLSAGMYTVTVTDESGCQIIKQYEIIEPTILSIQDSLRHVECFGANTGYVSLTITGGTTNYQVLWDDGNSNQERYNLISGIYEATIIDANGCSEIISYQINEPSKMQITGVTVQPNCNEIQSGQIQVSVIGGTSPYHYLWSNSLQNSILNHLNPGIYSLTVTDGNGCIDSSYSSEIYEAPISASINGITISPLCNGEYNGSINLSINTTDDYSLVWSTGDSTTILQNISAGLYTVTVTTSKGCISIATFDINEPAPLTLIGEINNVKCYGEYTGSIIVTASGGIAPYNYEWLNGPSIAENQHIQAGIYEVTVQDLNGCTATSSFEIIQPEALTLQLDTYHLIYPGEAVNLWAMANGGVYSYQYEWTENEIINCTSCQQQVIYPSDSTGLYVIATDANGCQISGWVIIDIITNIYIPNAFTPNNDGINDIFTAYSKGIKEYDLRIFNRWGEEIFHSKSIDKGWNGSYHDEEAKMDVYVYKINAVLKNGNEFQQTGMLNLIR